MTRLLVGSTWDFPLAIFTVPMYTWVMRVTSNLVKVATVLLANPDKHHWGYQTSRAAGVRSATLYRLLTRLVEYGWVTDGWEDPNTLTVRRPPRRYYVLTDRGRVELTRIIEEKR
jgi:PadR family transcriptional regulator PadR